ncbi:hypothetical protein BC832DRAFT_546906 [Gaertneriomyces semiglobifer]|nr:hypothetical protein BC832DRAFT_546906 [Gaertneriomyces semiglobifer]
MAAKAKLLCVLIMLLVSIAALAHARPAGTHRRRGGDRHCKKDALTPAPGLAPAPAPKPAPGLAPAPKPAPKPAPAPAPAPKPAPAPAPAPKPAPAPAPKPAPAPAPKPAPAPAPAVGTGISTVSPMPNGFKGLQSGIGSWFRANSGADSTNGKSWCGYPYNDNSNGFAPDIMVMTDNTNAIWATDPAKWASSAKQWCGLEAEVVNPENGKKVLMYIIDAFDHQWVKTPGSIDVMKGPWEKLTGRKAANKNDVIKGLQWKLTGKRNARYAFKGPGK